MYKKQQFHQVEDLRVKLNRMREKRETESKQPPPDPTNNFLNDPSRDETVLNECRSTNKFNSNHKAHSDMRYNRGGRQFRGGAKSSFQHQGHDKRVDNKNDDRIIKKEWEQGRPLNIKVEIQTETGFKNYSAEKSETFVIHKTVTESNDKAETQKPLSQRKYFNSRKSAQQIRDCLRSNDKEKNAASNESEHQDKNAACSKKPNFVRYGRQRSFASKEPFSCDYKEERDTKAATRTRSKSLENRGDERIYTRNRNGDNKWTDKKNEGNSNFKHGSKSFRGNIVGLKKYNDKQSTSDNTDYKKADENVNVGRNKNERQNSEEKHVKFDPKVFKT